MGYQDITFDVKEGIAIITLNRPEKRNALSEGMVEDIVVALDQVQRDYAIKVLIITGAGKAFCAGGDIKRMDERGGMFGGNLAELRDNYRFGIQRIPQALSKLDKPTIASVNGAAMGAGCDLTCMCDIRIASERAKFSSSFVNVGLVPGDGGTFFLPRVVGLSKACEMIFTGEVIDAKEAGRIGLVSRVVSSTELAKVTGGLASKIAKGPSVAIRMAKLAIYKGLESDLSANLDLLAHLQAIAQNTEDHMEGVKAFLDKRPPIFQGK
jgi:enoyl-CoA hydratase/carnithine racemase